MNITSHFIGIELENELFNDLFDTLDKYLHDNDIWDAIVLQDRKSLHITLYYLEKDLESELIEDIKKRTQLCDVSSNIYVDWCDYFYRNENKYVLFANIKTDIDVKAIRNMFHNIYLRDFIEENCFDFHAHMTIWKITNPWIFEKHRNSIEKIILGEFWNLENININTGNVCIYSVDSTKSPELQVQQ